MIKRKDYINPEGKKKEGYYPQVVRGKTVYLKELAKKTTEELTLNEVEAEAAVQLIINQIEKELLDSNHVCIDGFGTFSLTAESRLVENPDEIRAESIKVKRLVFIPSKIFMKRIKNAKFSKVKS